MFLRCTSYSKPNFSKQEHQHKNERISMNGQEIDQNAFSDFFIRKHPIINFNEHESNLRTQKISQKQDFFLSLKSKMNDEVAENQQNITHQGGFFVNPKKAFQINFLTQVNKKSSYLYQHPTKQNKFKFKEQKDLIQRRIRPNYSQTPRTSARYFNGNQTVQEQNFSPNQQKYQEKKSLQFASKQFQSQKLNAKQKQMNMLVSSYKIKSLILGRNPKEEIVNKSKKFMKIFLQKKNNKKINDASGFQQQGSGHCQNHNFLNSNRLNTESKNRNKYENCLPSPSKEGSRKTQRFSSIFGASTKKHQNQKQGGIQPWFRVNQDSINDAIHEIGIDFGEQKQTQNSPKNYLISITKNHSSTRNSYRKRHFDGQIGKAKDTITSQK